MEEPFRTLYWSLTLNGFPTNQWRYNVKLRDEAIYIGDDQQHFTVLRDHPGWHVTINGSHSGQVQGSFHDLVHMNWDVTPGIGDALAWFRSNRTNM
ncbi:Hypothetical protein A7982_09389 [Minicystis rosea]|nr:Hypothetical protein A7982_09389 [Minicystis rosea]